MFECFCINNLLRFMCVAKGRGIIWSSSLYVSVCVSLCVCFSICVCASLCVSVYLCVCVSLCVSVCVSLYVSVCLCYQYLSLLIQCICYTHLISTCTCSLSLSNETMVQQVLILLARLKCDKSRSQSWDSHVLQQSNHLLTLRAHLLLVALMCF